MCEEVSGSEDKLGTEVRGASHDMCKEVHTVKMIQIQKSEVLQETLCVSVAGS